jgi:cyclopropane fatty-acyl-phospholipid synthase-like methyltransferase
MSTDNYYKDLWNNPKTEAGQFFNKVDFNHQDYKEQEKVFRNFLKGLKRLKEVYEDQKPIETVLEVGAGKGRMSTIILEEFPDIKQFDVIDLEFEESFTLFDSKVDAYELDITSEDFDIPFRGKQYDLILASEVFMHIKPEDIESVLTRLTKLLAPQGLIVNIDWYHQKEPSEWCYIHDYEKMYRENGLYPVFMMDINKQKLFCYGK